MAISGENGIIKRAVEAREKTEQTEEEELRKLTQLEAIANLEDTVHTDNSTGKDVTVTIPAGFAVSQVEGENTIADGLVIIDSSGNEYVWIEVPRTEVVYPTATINIDFSALTGEALTNAYTAIENDLHTYTTTYRNETSYIDTCYSTEQTGLTSSEYTELKQTMLQSVYQNEGFWIGRYEAGIEKNRIKHSIIEEYSPIPMSQENKYPYTYIYCSEAQTLASMVNSGSYTSSLMFGLQWDLVLKYLEVKAVEKGTQLTTIQDELNSDSVSWGNYLNNTYNILSTISKYSLDYGTIWLSTPYNKSNSESVLLTTGASNKFSKQNIYDLAGNNWEWTLEYTSNTSEPCAKRGGGFDNYGSAYPTSARSDSGFEDSNGSLRISRIALLVCIYHKI